MLSPESVIATVISLALLVVTVQLARGRKLREEHALLWLVASVVILILSAFPEIVRALGAVFAVSDASTLVLVLGLVFVLAILLSHSVAITDLADHSRDLAQSNSILEWQIREVEANVSAPDPAATRPPRTGRRVSRPAGARRDRRIGRPAQRARRDRGDSVPRAEATARHNSADHRRGVIVVRQRHESRQGRPGPNDP